MRQQFVTNNAHTNLAPAVLLLAIGTTINNTVDHSKLNTHLNRILIV